MLGLICGPAFGRLLGQVPVAVSIAADQPAFQHYKSGIFDAPCGTNTDHNVLAVPRVAHARLLRSAGSGQDVVATAHVFWLPRLRHFGTCWTLWRTLTACGFLPHVWIHASLRSSAVAL